MAPRSRSPASSKPRVVDTPMAAVPAPLRWWIVPAALTAIMLGCGLNVIFLEVLVK